MADKERVLECVYESFAETTEVWGLPWVGIALTRACFVGALVHPADLAEQMSLDRTAVESRLRELQIAGQAEEAEPDGWRATQEWGQWTVDHLIRAHGCIARALET